jgi:hypothetical protein
MIIKRLRLMFSVYVITIICYLCVMVKGWMTGVFLLTSPPVSPSPCEVIRRGGGNKEGLPPLLDAPLYFKFKCCQDRWEILKRG